ncbi:MAG: hypothetical protein EOM59_02795 [Clostridia bacterium]|nr:hypothetical protein [Clostridia bacterium]
MKKQGFSSLYLTIILSSLLFFVLVIVEVTAGYAVRSVSEGLCMITGESLLSEYQKELYNNYGIFALRAFDEQLTSMAEFYINESLLSEGSDTLKVQLASCHVDSTKYPALDIYGFSQQIKAVATALTVKEIVSGTNFSNIFGTIQEAADTVESMKNQSEEQLENLIETTEQEQDTRTDPTAEEKSKARRQAAELLNRYRATLQAPNEITSDSKEVNGAEIRESLPSYLLGISQRGSILLSCLSADLDAGVFLENEYILNMCSYATDVREDCYLEMEAEYILYGRFSDSENREKIRSSLFWLRNVLNIAFIYGDSEKRTEVSALASVAFPFVPLPVSTFILSGIWAAVESQNDLNLLFEGKCVPFFKIEQDWKCSLLGSINGSATTNGEGDASSKIGTYDDYIRLLLLAIPKDEKLVRLMDVMQLNIANRLGRHFCFRDYAYGFSMTANFKKSTHLPGNDFASERMGTVIQEHVY